MTKLTGAKGPVDMINWDLSGFGNGDIISHTSTQFVLDDPTDNEVFTFTGKNFTYDAHGVTSGTLNGLSMTTADELTWTWSGMKVDIIAFRSVVQSNDLDGLMNMCFGGDDFIRGSAQNDALRGMAGADTIDGGKGDDLIYGGAGPDQLTGGKGADTFGYEAIGVSTSDGPDTITDLETRDRIDLSAIDANVGKSGDQAFKLVSAFSHHAGEAVLTYDEGNDRTSLQLDVNGDAVADGLIWLSGDQTGFHHFVM